MEDKAHRSDRKWRSARSPAAFIRALLAQQRPQVPFARLAAPLSWGANLWLLLIVWPAVSDGASSRLALAAATPLLGAIALASAGLVTLAGGCFLVVFPLGLASAFAADQRAGGSELPVIALVVIAASMWVYGAAVSRALRLPVVAESAGLRIEPLQGRGRSPRLHALRLRASRVRNAAVALTVVGAGAIALVAPGWGEAGELIEAFGDDPRHAAVLIAMVGLAIGAGVISVFTTALLRPPTPEDQRPPSPVRAALGVVMALAGAATYLMLRG